MKTLRYHRGNLAKHDVTISEAREALLTGWPSRRRTGDNYEVLGCTDEGRYLQLVVEEGRTSSGSSMDGT